MLVPLESVARREGDACLTAGFRHPRNVPSTPRLPLLAAFVALLAPTAFGAEPPRLAVVIVVDQFRGDYLAKFGPDFGEGGFRRLLANGVSYTQAHYRHAATLTAPGHATILTGTTPDAHGITSNDWLDRATWEMRNCVEDSSSPLVGISPAELGPVARGPWSWYRTAWCVPGGRLPGAPGAWFVARRPGGRAAGAPGRGLCNVLVPGLFR